MHIQIAGHEFARMILNFNPNHRVVLIHDPGDDYETTQVIRRLSEKCLFLEFFDLHVPSDTHRTATREDIEKAIEFGREAFDPDVETFGPEPSMIVSCTAGISRSAATAYVMRCAVMPPEEAMKVWNVRVHYPNKLICRLGAEILGNPEIYRVMEDFYEERARRRAIKGKPPKDEPCLQNVSAN